MCDEVTKSRMQNNSLQILTSLISTLFGFFEKYKIASVHGYVLNIPILLATLTLTTLSVNIQVLWKIIKLSMMFFVLTAHYGALI